MTALVGIVNIFFSFFAKATEVGTVIGVVQYCEVLLGRSVSSVRADTVSVATIYSVVLFYIDISVDAEVFVLANVTASLRGSYRETASVSGRRRVGVHVGINFFS